MAPTQSAQMGYMRIRKWPGLGARLLLGVAWIKAYEFREIIHIP